MKVVVYLILCLVGASISRKARRHGCTLTSRPPDPRSGCCGIDSSSHNLILGGEKTTIREYPWLALIEYKRRKRGGIVTQCGGVLISGRYVLTASHCVTGVILKETRPVSVRLGEYDSSNGIHLRDCVKTYRGKECASAPFRVAIQNIISHHKYNEELDIDDIALIRLAKLVRITDFIRPICLPTTDVTHHPPRHLKLQAAGWGIMYQKHFRTWTKQYNSNVKRVVDLPYRNQAECGREWNEYVGKRKLCAGGEKGKGTCMGDSGGPLMYENRGVFEVVGIVSYGHADECGAKTIPDVFTKVIAYKDWIMHNIH